jgi:hypothetical protein
MPSTRARRCGQSMVAYFVVEAYVSASILRFVVCLEAEEALVGCYGCIVGDEIIDAIVVVLWTGGVVKICAITIESPYVQAGGGGAGDEALKCGFLWIVPRWCHVQVDVADTDVPRASYQSTDLVCRVQDGTGVPDPNTTRQVAGRHRNGRCGVTAGMKRIVRFNRPSIP